MPMLERYLNAIAFWLPERQRQDIIAEISEDLNAQIDEQQVALGRSLNEVELAALLKRRGRPVLVANHYLPQRSLIGPIWFPAYLFALKMAGLCYVLPWLVVFVVVHRVQHPAFTWGTTFLAAWETLWTVALVAGGIVTLVFALLEVAGKKTRILENWNPRKLPPVRDPRRIPLSKSITDIVFNVAFLVWWLAYASSPLLIDGPRFKLTLGPVWTYFFWGCSAIAACHIALSALNMKSRAWTGLRAMCRLVLDLCSSVLFCLLLRVHLGATLYIANLSPAQMNVLGNVIRLMKDRCFPLFVIIGAIIAVANMVRIWRLNRKDRVGFARGITA